MLVATTLLATLALVAAQDPCGPTSKPPVSSTTSASPTSSSSPPPTGGVSLHPNGQSGWCIDIAGANFANGTPVQL